MYLKSIEIQGFKSFANKIRLEFQNGITAIVGPNGSGKSNVADAVRWVLGEQRIKQLRGSSMQDVIFSGTELRKPLGYAFVAITLDNSDKSLSIDYDEVTVSRRLYRSGESEYRINGNICRLKDVNELFYDTGIGKEGYSIIGQGQIDQILSSKPEDRRALFDEAAGIVKFKVRKEAALKKLENVKIGMTRLNDILSVLESRIEPLKKQSEKAHEYLKTREELKTIDVNLFLVENAQVRAQIDDFSKKHEIATSDYDQTNEQYEEAKEEHESLLKRVEELNEEIDAAGNDRNDASLTREKLQGQIRVLETKIEHADADKAHFHERIEEVKRQIAEKQAVLEETIRKKEGIDEEEIRLKKSREEAAIVLADATKKRQAMNDAIDATNERKFAALNERALVQSRLSSLQTRQEEINKRRSELTSRLLKAESEESRYQETIKELQADFERIGNEIKDLEEEIRKLEEGQAAFKGRLSDADASLRLAQEQYHTEHSKLEALRNLTERYEGYGGSVKRVMEQKKADRKSGIVGVVADIIRTEKKYETAIEIALGGNIQNIVTEDESSAKRMIDILKKERAGRATFLPLDSIREPQEFKTPEVLKEKGVVGMADELVDTDAKYRDVARTLLGRIVVIDHVDHALAIARKFHYGIRMVTLDGELLVPGGAISGGAFRNNSNLLGRRRELDQLEKMVNKALADIDAAQLLIDNTKKERNEVRAKLDQTRFLLNNKFMEQNAARVRIQTEEEKKKDEAETYAGLKDENRDISDRLEELNREREEAEDALKKSQEIEENCVNEGRKQQEELSGLLTAEDEAGNKVRDWDIEIEKISQRVLYEQENLERVRSEVKESEDALKELEESVADNARSLEQNKKDIEEIKKTIEASYVAEKEAGEKYAAMIEEREKLQKSQKDLFAAREELAEKRNALDAEIARLAMRRDQLQNSMESQINYMWSEYEITLSDAAELRDETLTDINAMKKRVGQLKNTIKSLGDVNVGAIEEYRVVGEEYSLKKGQYDDLVETGKQVSDIIQDLDQNMRDTFAREFARINQEFGVVFKEMFGGGKGSLELIEEEDILVAGIRIIAQPPGKRLQNMMQLSGGEKALTAIALLFAIQNLKPSPFCLLDEIEAALDENNVVRFARYLHKLTGSIQFIVITHRRGTMDQADRLYGITMQEKGVSALVSVDLIDKEITN
ncbi:MAG: chromosome segregation protein SMC [Lachnospiraceae bacterium]|nr:chromosome segregation protein SMC [Lachnospiraceae bacterium]